MSQTENITNVMRCEKCNAEMYYDEMHNEWKCPQCLTTIVFVNKHA